ncbi:MAG TPA: hypothetical protein VEZ12_24115, partial [Herpetosiphonaceae bacterium]|nr:hypothetical protein [Herpetosiphonaceae bacterium]
MFQVHSSDMQPSIRSNPTGTTTKVGDWREQAVAAYCRSEPTASSLLFQELTTRVLELTGQRVDLGAIQLDRTTQTATVAVGDMQFQLRGRELCLVRPCVHCGARRFVSAAIHDLVDL